MAASEKKSGPGTGKYGIPVWKSAMEESQSISLRRQKVIPEQKAVSTIRRRKKTLL